MLTICANTIHIQVNMHKPKLSYTAKLQALTVSPFSPQRLLPQRHGMMEKTILASGETFRSHGYNYSREGPRANIAGFKNLYLSWSVLIGKPQILDTWTLGVVANSRRDYLAKYFNHGARPLREEAKVDVGVSGVRIGIRTGI